MLHQHNTLPGVTGQSHPVKGGGLFWMSPPLAPRRNIDSLQHYLTTPMESNNKWSGEKSCTGRGRRHGKPFTCLWSNHFFHL